MSQAIKNLIIAFTILCAFVFVVFLIQLLVLNSGNADSREAAPPESTTSAAGSESPSPGRPAPNGNTSPAAGSPSGNSASPGGSTPSGDAETDESEPENEGSKYEFPVDENRNLVLYVNEEIREQQFGFFEPESEEIFCVLSFKGNGTAALELRYVFLRDGVRAVAETLLDEYVGDGETAVIGEAPIRGSGIRGTAVTGSKEKLSYEAWVCSFADVGSADTGIAVIIYYDNPLQKNALYEILDTLKFVQQ